MANYADVIKPIRSPFDLLALSRFDPATHYLRMADGEALCLPCAERERDELTHALKYRDGGQWLPTHLMEADGPVCCAHCGDCVDHTADYTDYHLSAHYLPALYHGDLSGLSDVEEAAWCDFEDALPAGQFGMPLTDEPELLKCDVSGLLSECYRVRRYP